MTRNPMSKQQISENVVDYYTSVARREQSRAFALVIERIFSRN